MNQIAKIFAALLIASLVSGTAVAQKRDIEHEGQYRSNLTYKGLITGDEIPYTLYLPPEYDKAKGPFPLIAPRYV